MAAILGVLFVMFGGLASGAFYLPLKYVKNWSWESGWIVQGVSAWLLSPWIIVLITVPGLFHILGQAPSDSILLPILFGIGWGIGGLTWGLSIRYLGIGLGNTLPLGLTSALSTIISPLVPIITRQTDVQGSTWSAIHNQLQTMFSGTGGAFILGSIVLSLIGILVCGLAASYKERDLNKKPDKSEYNLKKGLVVVLVAGIMSACFAFGEATGKSLADITESYNPGTIWKYNGVYAVLLIGGLFTNLVYCIYLAIKNKSYTDFVKGNTPLKTNYLFAILAGVLWFAQFVFKGIGTTRLPASMNFISWTVLFSSVIVFSNIIGIIAGEWKGVGLRTRIVLLAGMLCLIVSVGLVGIASRTV